MKRGLIVTAATAAIAISMSMTSFAGQWLSDATGWWWRNDDGTYPANMWMWLDGNGDRIAECYYFNESGYCLMNTQTPDGYTVDPNGAWTINGAVQMKVVDPAPASAPTDSVSSGSEKAKESGNDKKKADTLLDLKPTETSNGSGEFKNAVTYENEMWGRGIRIHFTSFGGNNDHSVLEYELNGDYNRLTFTVSPGPEEEKWWDDGGFSAILYGDDDKVLWSADYEAGGDYPPEEVSVDISGQEMIRFYGTAARETTYPRDVLFKGLELE